MKKNDPQIKNDFTLKMQDEIDAIEMIADMFFRDIKDDDGNITAEFHYYIYSIKFVTKKTAKAEEAAK